ncbi:MAG: hypothetical protein WBA74_21560 [Cyclobacteriaceae bacterium]
MAGRLGSKLKGFMTLWYGVVLLLGIAAAIIAVLYWAYQMVSNQQEMDWGVTVLLLFLVSIVSLAIYFLPRFRARKKS